MEETKNGMGPNDQLNRYESIGHNQQHPAGSSIYGNNGGNGGGIGNAQSSSMASGGHQSAMMQSS